MENTQHAQGYKPESLFKRHILLMPAYRVYGKTGYRLVKMLTDYKVDTSARLMPMNFGTDSGILTADLPNKTGEWCVLGCRIIDGGPIVPCCFSVAFKTLWGNRRVTIGAYPGSGSNFGWAIPVIRVERIK